MQRRRKFQSTPPSRVATKTGIARDILPSFQSTPPSRVATGGFVCVNKFFGFQSTPPSRVATALVPLLIFSITISIHTTLAGGDSGSLCPEGFLFISIHTTLAGGDWVFSEDFVPGEIFQSTPPSRVATLKFAIATMGKIFQSTPPSRVATLQQDNIISVRGFQSTPPSRVATTASECRTQNWDISIHTTLAGGDSSCNPMFAP